MYPIFFNIHSRMSQFPFHKLRHAKVTYSMREIIYFCLQKDVIDSLDQDYLIVFDTVIDFGEIYDVP